MQTQTMKVDEALMRSEHVQLSVPLYWAIIYFSYDVTSGSEITPCNKTNKPQVVYRFTGNAMMSITTLRT